MSQNRGKDKFFFGPDFQADLLKFTVTDKKSGFKALNLFHDEYFQLLHHQVIALALKSYYRKKKKVPGKVALRESLRQIYVRREYAKLLTPEDKKKIAKTLSWLYKGNVKDGDTILEETKKFARFVKLKDTLEKIDITNFENYDRFSKEVQKAITTGNEFEETKGTFLVRDVIPRMIKRHSTEPSLPTPFKQINAMFDTGGTEKGNIVVIIGKEKRYKTMTMVNFAKGYMRQKKRVIYFDLENGEGEIAMRFDQSLLRKGKKEILSQEYDSKLSKLLRKYRRIGGEVLIKRMPAYRTTTADLQQVVDDIYREYGIRFEICIIDYVGLMGATSGKTEDKDRISDAYVDTKNFADYNGFDVVYTGHHTTREGNKRESTRYLSNDTAKCIDIARHCDVMMGLNQNEEEEKANVIRVEIVEQRKGPQDARAFFWIDKPCQYMQEFNQKELSSYREQLREAEKPQRSNGDIQ